MSIQQHVTATTVIPDHRLITLDGLRGLAALIVAAGHLHLLPWAHFGLAVDFFFMLSGYVLLRTYDGRLGDDHAVRHYLLRRAIRLVPLLTVGVAVGGVVSAIGLGSATALKPWPDNWLVAWDPPGWSLVYEGIASVAIGLGVWQRWTRVETGLLLLGALGLVVATIHSGSPNGGFTFGQVHYGLVRMLYGFSAGALVYRLPPLPRLPWWAVVVAFGGVLLLPLNTPTMLVSLTLLALPILLWMGASAQAMPLGRELGELSYPLYILHTPLYAIVAPWPPLARLCVAIVVAVLALKLFDQPLRDRLLDWERQRRGAGRDRYATSVAGS